MEKEYTLVKDVTEELKSALMGTLYLNGIPSNATLVGKLYTLTIDDKHCSVGVMLLSAFLDGYMYSLMCEKPRE